MSEDKTTMSVAAYARARDADEETVRHQIRIGVIARPISGRIDVAQADAAWARIRRSRITVQQDDAGRRSAEAKMAGLATKLRLARDQLEGARERYINRLDAVSQSAVDAAFLLDELAKVPARQAPEVARLLNLDPAVARSILDRFIAAALAELGDLQGEVIELAQAA
jgi:hypothetical protein